MTISHFNFDGRSSGRQRTTPPRRRHAVAIGLIISMLLSAAFQENVRAQNDTSKLAPIQITPERRQLIGLQFAKVEEKELVDRIDNRIG